MYVFCMHVYMGSVLSNKQFGKQATPPLIAPATHRFVCIRAYVLRAERAENFQIKMHRRNGNEK